MRSSSVVSHIGPRAEVALRRRMRLRKRRNMSAAAPAHARAPIAAAINVGIKSGGTDAGKSAIDAADEVTVDAAAQSWVALLAGSAVAATILGVELAGRDSGQRVATAAVAFQTFAELASLL